jgi:hypothetical protein
MRSRLVPAATLGQSGPVRRERGVTLSRRRCRPGRSGRRERCRKNVHEHPVEHLPHRGRLLSCEVTDDDLGYRVAAGRRLPCRYRPVVWERPCRCQPRGAADTAGRSIADGASGRSGWRRGRRAGRPRRCCSASQRRSAWYWWTSASVIIGCIVFSSNSGLRPVSAADGSDASVPVTDRPRIGHGSRSVSCSRPGR